MSKLLRYFSDNNVYFISLVTHQRQKILQRNPSLFLKVLTKIQEKYNFNCYAWVVLPNHIHFIIEPKSYNPADIIHDFKLSYGAYFRKENKLLKGKLWQDRYWDHVIRNQEDMNKHIDYIHYNPVKHGYSNSPFEWDLSSINEFEYQKDWGVKKVVKFNGKFGE